MNRRAIQEAENKALLQSFQNGCERSLNRLLDQYKRRVYAYIITSVKDSAVAKDLLQETLLKAFQSIRKGGYREDGRFEPWIIRIAHNVIMDYYRDSKRDSFIQFEADWGRRTTYCEMDMTPEQSIIARENRNLVREWVELLPQTQRDVVIMRHAMNMSFQEIADYTGVSINTALGRMRYALMNLRKSAKAEEVLIA